MTIRMRSSRFGPCGFSSELWRYEGDDGWCFVTLPPEVSDEVRARGAGLHRPLESLRVEARIAAVSWRTSLFSDRRRDTYLLPVKAEVRPTRELADGVRMPVLGLGVWQMAAGAVTEQAVEWALEAGYRHVDTATLYRNERSVGAALKRSGLPREQFFVTTKLLPPRPSAAKELEKSLERLRLEYVDLYLIHWPLPLWTVRAWRQLESLRERGLARAIGVSNLGLNGLETLIRGSAQAPAVDQVQFSPFRYRCRLLDYCLRQRVVFEAYSPLEQGGGLTHPTITALAERLGRTPAQVMLRWAIQHEAVVIPKSSRKERIWSNAQVFDFELADADVATLDALDQTNGSARARG